MSEYKIGYGKPHSLICFIVVLWRLRHHHAPIEAAWNLLCSRCYTVSGVSVTKEVRPTFESKADDRLSVSQCLLGDAAPA
jgi:hypothetical protein